VYTVPGIGESWMSFIWISKMERNQNQILSINTFIYYTSIIIQHYYEYTRYTAGDLHGEYTMYTAGDLHCEYTDSIQ